MSKVICAICGTSYPDNSECCPVCGYSQTSGNEIEEISDSAGYTPVKGGRFSASNVKKRNAVTPAFAKPTATVSKKQSKNKSNAGAIVVIVLLFLAIIAVAGYIALRFFIPNDFLYEGLGGMKDIGGSQQVEESPNLPEDDHQLLQPTLDCTALSIRNDIPLNAIGATYQLVVMPEPVNTEDQVTYVTSNEAVATVDASGLITAVGEGEAVITIRCGTVSTECFVAVTVPVEAEIVKFMLNRKEIVFETEGEQWTLYDGVIPADDIVWSSDDTNVATVENGTVVAVGNGETVVYGVYEGQTATCQIRCSFDSMDEDTSSNVSEATSDDEPDDNKTYSLYNPQGQAKDVTIGVGKTFVLQLVDEDKNVVTDANWTVDDTNVCTYDQATGTVTGVHGGMAHITATYKGQTYTCIVRVA